MILGGCSFREEEVCQGSIEIKDAGPEVNPNKVKGLSRLFKRTL